MGFSVPYVVDGAKHSARLFRRQAQKQVGPGSGVDRADDLKVQALNVPGTGFRVGPGGGSAQSRDTTASGRETYGPDNDAEVTVMNVPGTGSSGARRDLVILEITDPEMQSVAYPAPPDPKGTGGWLDGDNFCRITVIPDVNALVPPAERPVRRLEQITSGQYAHVTGITLAAINWPASTATIQPSMIEDLRRVQKPNRDSAVFARPRIVADDGPRNWLVTRTSDGGQIFPGGAGYSNEFEVFIPEFATRMIVDPGWLSVQYIGGKNVWGRYWMEFGDEYRPNTWPGKQSFEFATQHFQFDANETGATHRTNWLLKENVPVPVKLRGKKVKFVFKAGLGSNTSTGTFPTDGVSVDALSGLACELTFVESTGTVNDAI